MFVGAIIKRCYGGRTRRTPDQPVDPPSTPTAPTAPSELEATAIAQASIAFRWSASLSTDALPVVGYRVYQNDVIVADQLGTSTIVAGLSASTTYTFHVIGYTEALDSSASADLVVTTLAPVADTTPPTAPVLYPVTNIGADGFGLSWQASTDAVGVAYYAIYANGLYHGYTDNLGYTASGFAASTSVTFSVRAFDNAGNRSTASNAVLGETPPAPFPNNRTLAGAMQVTAVRSAGDIAVTPVSSPGVSISGGVLTINGSGFGTRAAKPLAFDDFSSGSVGAEVYGQAPTLTSKDGGSWVWDTTSSGLHQPKYSNANQRDGTNNVLLRYGGTSLQASAWTCGLKINHPMPNTGDEIYFTKWWRYEDTSVANTGTQQWSRNTKPFDYWPSSEGSAPFVYVGMGNPDVGNGELRYNGIDQYVPWDATTQLDLIDGEWIRFEVYLKQSAPNTSNGYAEVHVHRTGTPSIASKLLANATSTRTAMDSYWENLWIGAYSSTEEVDGGASYLAFSDVHMDNVYVDSTRARVEIGNAATWAACTRREIQPSITWSNTAITAKYYKGLLSSGINYVFVVSASGVPSSGYAITL